MYSKKLLIIVLALLVCFEASIANPQEVERESLYDSLLSLRKQGKYESAVSFAGELVERFNKEEDKRFVGRVKIQWASLLCMNHQCFAGISIFKEALTIGLEINDNRIVGDARLGIGMSYAEKGEMDSAYLYLENNLKYVQESGDSISYGGYLSNLGFLANQSGDYLRAIHHYNTALQIWSILERDDRTAEDLINIGRTRMLLGNYAEAILNLKESISISKKLGLKENQDAGELQLSKVYERIGDFELAFKSLDSAYEKTVIEIDSVQKRLAESNEKARSSELQLLNERQEVSLEQLRLIITISGVLVVLLVMTVIYTIQRRRALKKVSDQKINDLLQQQEIRSLQGVLAGQETERNRIAADLHDKLGAILGMVKLHFSAVEERIDSLKEDNKLQYEKANALLDQASEEVRNISHNLISGVLTKFGLVPALKDLKDTIESTGKLKVNLSLSELEARLDGESELQIYRIIQELLSNILKHAQATEADIQLTRHNGNLNLMVHDNGIGFDPEAARSKKGIGMQNLQARVEQLKGTLHYDSGKGGGTTVTIDIPL